MKEYKFLDFKVNSQQHALFKSGEKLEIGTTAFNVLLVFLQKPGQVIKRDELFEQVWPDKIVTDATLYKQVQRLRKALGDTAEDKTIISTVHGVGFEFLPEVIEESISTSSPQATENTHLNKSNSKSKTYLLIFAALFLVTYFVVTQIFNKDDMPELSIISDVEAQPLTVAMIPSFVGNDDEKQEWMANGGVYYLAETFDRAQVNIKKYSKRNLKQTDPDQFALELSLKNSIDASVIFDVIEKDRQFISAAKIRNKEGIISEKKFTASSVTNLLDDISLWSKQVLNLESYDISPVMSDNRYAVENYIRGMSAQLTGDAKTAIKYFELAIKEDDGFWLAWFELSISYRKQGDNEKALSIINSLDKITQVDKYKLMLRVSKGNIFYRSGEYNEALEEYDRGIALARKLKDNSSLASLLTNKTFVASTLGQLELAMDSISESIDLINARSGDNSSSLGGAYNTLSGLYIKLNQYTEASKYSISAIENFKKAGDLRYETTAKSRYAGILYDLGQVQKAKKINQELLVVRQSLEDIPGQLSSLLRLIQLHTLLGEFNQADNYVQDASDLLDVTGNKLQGFGVSVFNAELKLLQGQLPLAEDILNKIKDQEYSSAHLFMVLKVKLILFELQNDQEQWKKLILEISQNPEFENKTLTYLFRAQLAIKENDKQHAEFMLEKAKTSAISKQKVLTIARVMNVYIEFLIDNNETLKAQQLVDELANFRPQDYPYLKNKARLAFLNKEYFAALTFMQQLKNTANDHWKVEDMMLLEKYQGLQNSDEQVLK